MASSLPLLRSSVFLYMDTAYTHKDTVGTVRWTLCQNQIWKKKGWNEWVLWKCLFFQLSGYLCPLTRCNSAPTQVQHTSAFSRICLPAQLTQQFPTQTTVFMVTASEISTLDFLGTVIWGTFKLQSFGVRGALWLALSLGSWSSACFWLPQC